MLAKRDATPFPFTLEQVERLLERINDGVHAEVAATLARLSQGKLKDALTRGQRDFEQGLETTHSAFFEAIAEANAAPELEAVRDIRKAGVMDPRARQWYLERRYPARWAPRVVHEVRKEIDQIFDRLAMRFADRPELLREICATIAESATAIDDSSIDATHVAEVDEQG